MADRDRLSSRLRDNVFAFTGNIDLHLPETRQVIRQRLIELKQAALVEHHRGNRGNRLCHRINAEYRIAM